MTHPAPLPALLRFRDALPPLFLLDDVAERPDLDTVVDPALAALRGAFVDADPAWQAPDARGLVELAAMILGAHGGFDALAFDDVARQVAHPAALRTLAPLFATIAGEDLAPRLIEALQDRDPAAVLTALRLSHWLAGPGRPAFTAAEIDALRAEVARLRADPATDPAIRDELGQWIGPRARR